MKAKIIDYKIPFFSIVERLAPWAIAIVSASIGTYLTTLTKWLDQAGPIIYAIAFVVFFFCYILGSYLLIKINEKRLILKVASTLSNTGDANPLQVNFEHKKIKVSEFFNPFLSKHRNKRFEHCQITGPGNLLLLGCYIKDATFNTCQIVVINDNPTKLFDVTIFESCTILNSTIVGCTLFLRRQEYMNLSAEMKAYLPVVSDSGLP